MSQPGKAAKPRKETLTPVRARKEAWKKIVVDLYLQGHNMQEVAKLAEEATGGHKFSPAIVGRYVDEAIQLWRKSTNDMVDNHKSIELAKINRLEAEYWCAWLRSQQVVKAKSTIKNKDQEGGRLKVATVRDDEKPSVGDPQFLRGIQWCIDKRCVILGIDVPQAPIQINQNNQTNIGNTTNITTIARRVVFKTRETVVAPQTFTEPNLE